MDSRAGGARLIVTFLFEASAEADGSKPSAPTAGMLQKQHGIERSVFDLAGMLGLTFGLDTLIADMLLLMPYCTRPRCAP